MGGNNLTNDTRDNVIDILIENVNELKNRNADLLAEVKCLKDQIAETQRSKDQIAEIHKWADVPTVEFDEKKHFGSKFEIMITISQINIDFINQHVIYVPDIMNKNEQCQITAVTKYLNDLDLDLIEYMYSRKYHRWYNITIVVAGRK